MQSLSHKQDYLINTAFLLGLILSLIPDVFLYDRTSAFRFDVAARQIRKTARNLSSPWRPWRAWREPPCLSRTPKPSLKTTHNWVQGLAFL